MLYACRLCLSHPLSKLRLQPILVLMVSLNIIFVTAHLGLANFIRRASCCCLWAVEHSSDKERSATVVSNARVCPSATLGSGQKATDGLSLSQLLRCVC